MQIRGRSCGVNVGVFDFTVSFADQSLAVTGFKSA
jgi:hypothetical protein